MICHCLYGSAVQPGLQCRPLRGRPKSLSGKMYTVPTRPKANNRNKFEDVDRVNNKNRRRPSGKQELTPKVVIHEDVHDDDLRDLRKMTEAVLRKVRNDIRSSHKRVIDVFHDADEDDSGTLDPNEIKHALTKIGCHLTSTEMSHLMQFLDEDGDGEVDYREFSTKLNATDTERLAQIKKRLGPTDEEKFQMRLDYLSKTVSERVTSFAERNVAVRREKQESNHNKSDADTPRDAMRKMRQIMRKYKFRAKDLLNIFDKNRDGLIDTNELYNAFRAQGATHISYKEVKAFINDLRHDGMISHIKLYEIMHAVDEDFQKNMVKRMPDQETKEKHLSSNSSLPSLVDKDLDTIGYGKAYTKPTSNVSTNADSSTENPETDDFTMDEIDNEIQALIAQIEQQRKPNLSTSDVDANCIQQKWRTSGDYNVLNGVFLNEFHACKSLLQHAEDRKKDEVEAWQIYWMERMTAVAVRIQNAWRTKIARDLVYRARRDRAACLVQCAVRRRLARKELRRRQAARYIQAYYRGFYTRVFVKKKKKLETHCAVLIQKIVRRKLSRKRMRWLRQKRNARMAQIWKMHTLRISARLIQRYLRSYQERMKGYRFRLVVQAMRAKTIQESSRRFSEESEESTNIEEDLRELLQMKKNAKGTINWVNHEKNGEKTCKSEIDEDEDDTYSEDEFDSMHASPDENEASNASNQNTVKKINSNE
eukprot:g3635.t1